MSPLRIMYLALMVWGSIHPLRYFLEWFQDNRFSISGLIDAWHTIPATSALVWDLTIASIALTIWIIAETRVRRNWSALWAVPATFAIGISCGLPLYLFLRTRAVA